MKAFDYMMQYKRCQVRIGSYRRDIELLRDRAAGLSSTQYDSDRVQSSHDPDKMGAAIADLSDTIEKLSAEVIQADRTMLEVERVISKVSRPQYQEVLKWRYIYEYEHRDPKVTARMTDDERAARITSWEVIARRMNYSGQSVWKFHKAALREVEKIINGQ